MPCIPLNTGRLKNQEPLSFSTANVLGHKVLLVSGCKRQKDWKVPLTQGCHLPLVSQYHGPVSNAGLLRSRRGRGQVTIRSLK